MKSWDNLWKLFSNNSSFQKKKKKLIGLCDITQRTSYGKKKMMVKNVFLPA